VAPLRRRRRRLHRAVQPTPPSYGWYHKVMLRFIHPSICLSRFLIPSRSLDIGMRMSPFSAHSIRDSTVSYACVQMCYYIFAIPGLELNEKASQAHKQWRDHGDINSVRGYILNPHACLSDLRKTENRNWEVTLLSNTFSHAATRLATVVKIHQNLHI